MNKIYTGIIALVAMTTVVAGSAYALFASQVEINGITLGTETSGLLVSLGNENSFGATRTMDPNFQLAPLSPGETSTPGAYTLKNTGQVSLNLTAKITAAGGDWGALSPVLEGVTCTASALVYDSLTPIGCDTSNTAQSTGWANLAYWNTNDVPLPGGPLANGQDRQYFSFYRLPSSANSSVAGKTITNMAIKITGTQVTP